uniref:RNase H family protein n=1 Tax=Solanum tuberosum TaxID=4113 RepID=M1CB19_SOLTU
MIDTKREEENDGPVKAREGGLWVVYGVFIAGALVLLVKPNPVLEDDTDDRWKWFKVDPNVKSMNLKKGPLFADWEEIFGKDRATGKFAEGPEDDVEEIERIEAQ